MITFLAGKKTYIVGSLTIAYGIIGFYIGQLDSVSALGFVFAGLTAMGFRSALTTELQNLAAMLPDKKLPPQQ
jgi:hypothetical protein